jgi:hypothetical protein
LHRDADEGAGRGPFADREIDHRAGPQDQQIGQRHQGVDATRDEGAEREIGEIRHRARAR